MEHTLYALPREEIHSAIEKASVFGGRLAQSCVGGAISATIERIDLDCSGHIYLKIREKIDLEQKRPVIIKLNYRHISFCLSSRDYSLEGNTLISHLPKEARAIALRNSARYIINHMTLIQGSLQRVEKRGETFSRELRLVDVSRRGLGLIIPHFEDGGLQANDHIWIKNLSLTEFKKPLFGRVVYLFERNFKNASEFKCGISLDSELTTELFQELKKMCRLILKA